MKGILIGFVFWSVLVLSSCGGAASRHAAAAGKVALEQYEAYLKNAVYGRAHYDADDPFLDRQKEIEYFTLVAGNRKIAEIIYNEAEKYSIEPELAFAVVFSESSFNPRAVHQNRQSVDRGLFQLNSRSFPDLDEEEFFDPEVNVPLGMAYLRYCLDMGGNEVAALAMYNAGPARVKRSQTPRMTLDYVARIQEYKESLSSGIIPREFSPEFKPVPCVKRVKKFAVRLDGKERIL